MSLNLFIIGPSGCGKSTQAKLIAEKYNLTHLSMGQLLRDEMAAKSELGLKAQSYVDQGIWAPDDLVVDILESNLSKINNQNFIIDGFPRMLNQGQQIAAYLDSVNEPMDGIILLDVSFQEIMDRRAKKGQEFQDASRTDSTPEAIAKRQQSYDDSINPIIDFYQSAGKLVNVDGNRPVEPIFIDICQFIDKINK